MASFNKVRAALTVPALEIGREVRAAAMEECAKVAESKRTNESANWDGACNGAAAAIRARAALTACVQAGDEDCTPVVKRAKDFFWKKADQYDREKADKEREVMPSAGETHDATTLFDTPPGPAPNTQGLADGELILAPRELLQAARDYIGSMPNLGVDRSDRFFDALRIVEPIERLLLDAAPSPPAQSDMQGRVEAKSSTLRCDNCDNGVELEWEFCAWCGSVKNWDITDIDKPPGEELRV